MLNAQFQAFNALTKVFSEKNCHVRIYYVYSWLRTIEKSDAMDSDVADFRQDWTRAAISSPSSAASASCSLDLVSG